MTRPIARRAASFSVAIAIAALSIAVGATAAAAEDPTPGTEPTPSVSVEPTPSTSPSTSPSPSDPPAPAPAQQPAPKPGANTDEPPGTGTISGWVWHDADKDGIQDKGEQGVAGIPVFPVPAHLSNELAAKRVKAAKKLRPGASAEDDLGGYTLTDDNGKYVLEDVPAGMTRVGILGETPDFALWQFSNKGQGDDRTLDSDFTEDRDTGQAAWGALSDYVDVTNGAEFDLDGGIHPREDAEAKTADVRGQVWNDKNRNGIQDTGEPGLANVPVFVFPNDEDEDDQAELRKRAGDLTDNDGLTRKAGAAADGAEVLILTGADGRYEAKDIQLDESREIAVLVFPFTVDANGDFDEVWKVTKPDQGPDATKDSDVYPTKLDDPELPDVAEYGTLVFPARPGSETTVDAGLYRDEAPAPGDGGGELPTTGFAIGGFLLAGTALVGTGVALTLAARRRRQIAA